MLKQFYIIYLGLILFFASACQKDNKALVVGKIKKASELATTQFTIDKLVYGVKEKNLFWVVNLNKSSFLAESQAFVKAGINLDELTADDIIIEGERISLHLPHVRVITFSYPANRFKEIKEYSHDFAFNRISVAEKEKLFRDAEIDIRNSLKYMDITKTTQDKTRTLFEVLLRNLGYSEIYIDFREGKLISEVNLEILR